MLDLLLPRPCAGCGDRHGPWCSGCASALPLALLHLTVPLGPALAEAVGAASGDLPLVAATPYADGGRRLLLAFKEGGRHELGERVGQLLAAAVLGAVLASGGSDRVRLVPVPSRPHSRRARGADLGLVVARLAATRLRRAGWDARALSLLRHRRSSADQAGLARAGRLRNVAGSLTAAGAVGPVVPGPLLVVDDIVTTGATLREAARALLVAGWPVTGAAVVAATPAGPRAPALPRGDTPLSSASGGG